MKTVTIYDRRGVFGQSGPRGVGGHPAIRGVPQGALRRGAPHHQQPDGAYWRHHCLGGAEGACEVELYSDSKYVIDALQKGWAKGWRAVGGSSRTRSRPSTLTCGSGFSRCASATPSVSTGSRATRIIPIITAVTSWRLRRAENINKPLGPRSSGAALAPYITLHVHRARHETVQRLRRMKCLCMWAVPAYALSSHGRAAVSGRMANSAMLLHSK